MFAADTEYNIYRDYDGLTQAVCFYQNMIGWKYFLQGKLLPDWMDIINTEWDQLDLINKTLNLWLTRCEFIHGGSTGDKIIKKCWILLQQVEDLKACRNILGPKGKDHIDGTPEEGAQFWVLRVWIRTAQALYRQVKEKQARFLTYRITTYFRLSHQNG